MFTKILIANRGEIACRIIRTARRLGISCIAVFSEIDANALHVKLADEAYCIGPAPTRESYLRGNVIIETALKAGAQAIHPGYGFLSENAEFAEACAKAGICFIGPPAAAIRAMGSKSKAKEIMEKAGVPLVPGYHGTKQDLATLQQAAEKIGYPVLLKAAAGGGGKGMRVVIQATDLEVALHSAKREAQSSFGDDLILIEKYLTQPRHIEMQVFADTQGNVVHLFERDCSIQRRHQKIIEEAPAPNFSLKLRKQMGETAIAAAKAIGYVGAGTIEFLYDEDGSFYFMEMNTRLQVEHPVTEMITKQDLVEWQLRIANGEPLPCQQKQLNIHGHAFETRIYAEDPNHDFLPSVGQINYLKTPDENAFTRLDTGIRQGDQITPFYDPMMAKLIVWGEDRTSALEQLQKALAKFQVIGVTTNLNLLTAIARNSEFATGELSTNLIANHQQELIVTPALTTEILALTAVYILHLQKKTAQQNANLTHDPSSPWFSVDNWRLNLPAEQTLYFSDSQEYKVVIQKIEPAFIVKTMDQVITIQNLLIEENNLTATLLDQEAEANIFVSESDIYVLYKGLRYHFSLSNNKNKASAAVEVKSHLTAPMPGRVVALLAKVNTEVEADTGLAVIEAMKMEHTIHAPTKGIIKEWYFQVGDLVEEGVELLRFEPI